MIKIIYLIAIAATLTATISYAQNKQVNSPDYFSKNWKYVATLMPDAWYSSDDAKMAADSVLKYQTEFGGWPKNSGFHNGTVNQAEMAKIKKTGMGGTFDNDATITELRFLAKVYLQFFDERYKKAFEKGLGFIFKAQYENGGWPQYFPVKKAEDEILLDNTKPYSMHITYNDNAMVNIMQFLKDIFSDNEAFVSLQLSNDVKVKAQNAFDKGVGCILKTQIIVNGKPTVWCAQHDEITLAPANARAYELASFSGAESVGILMLLMDIENPSKEIIDAVRGGAKWLENHKIEEIKLDTEIDQDGRKNRIVVEDKNGPFLWARFYDLETQKPFFCSRDGIKRNSLSEISYERRNGYSWYTNAPQLVLNKYPEWIKKCGIKSK